MARLITMSLAPNAAHGCSHCSRVFGSYVEWCDRFSHSCAAFNDRHPILLESVTTAGAVDRHDRTSND